MVWLKRGVVVAAVAGLAALLWVVWDHEAVMAWIGQAGPVPFFAAMGLLPALGAPLAPFFIVAGATFGVAVGLVGSVLALLLNFAVCYRLARSRFRPRLEKLLRRFDFEIPDFEEPGKSALRFTLLVKLAPGIPVFVKNYGLGAAGVPFGIYLGTGMLITGGYGLLLVVLGESLMEHDLDGILAVAAVVVVLTVGLWWWRRRKERDPTAAPATSLLGGALALLVGSTASAAEPPCPENEPATQCAAKQEENPIAGIVNVQLQNNTSYLIGPNERTLNVLNLQPIIPLSLGKKLTLVALSRIPLVWSPNGAMPTGTTFGMGDITTNLFVSGSARRIVRWGLGPVLQFPTGTHRNLGAFDSGKFSLGPTGALFVTPGPFVAGVTVFNAWSVAGRETSRKVNLFRLQPFFNYNLPDGWYLVTSPEILADWTVADDDGWLVPVGAGFGRVGLLKSVGGALGLEVQAFWNAARPDFGPPWTLRVQAAFFLPKLDAKPPRSKRTSASRSRSTLASDPRDAALRRAGAR